MPPLLLPAEKGGRTLEFKALCASAAEFEEERIGFDRIARLDFEINRGGSHSRPGNRTPEATGSRNGGMRCLAGGKTGYPGRKSVLNSPLPEYASPLDPLPPEPTTPIVRYILILLRTGTVSPANSSKGSGEQVGRPPCCVAKDREKRRGRSSHEFHPLSPYMQGAKQEP